MRHQRVTRVRATDTHRRPRLAAPLWLELWCMLARAASSQVEHGGDGAHGRHAEVSGSTRLESDGRQSELTWNASDFRVIGKEAEIHAPLFHRVAGNSSARNNQQQPGYLCFESRGTVRWQRHLCIMHTHRATRSQTQGLETVSWAREFPQCWGSPGSEMSVTVAQVRAARSQPCSCDTTGSTPACSA